MIEILKWIAGIAAGAAIGGVVGTRLAIYLIERRAAKTSDKFIKAIKANPEFTEYSQKIKEILDFSHGFIKKLKEKQNKKI